MKYRGWTIYAEGAINNWVDFELDGDGDIRVTEFISDDGEPDARNISGYVILSDESYQQRYQQHCETLDAAREIIDVCVLRDAAALVLAAWKDPDYVSERLMARAAVSGGGVGPRLRAAAAMDALESALRPWEYSDALHGHSADSLL